MGSDIAVTPDSDMDALRDHRRRTDEWARPAPTKGGRGERPIRIRREEVVLCWGTALPVSSLSRWCSSGSRAESTSLGNAHIDRVKRGTLGPDQSPPLQSLPFFSREDDLIVRRAPADAVPYAVFEGRLPTPRESRSVDRRGFGVHLLTSLRNGEGARFAATLPSLAHLQITGADLELAWLSELRGLQSLQIYGVVGREAGLGSLRNLQIYGGVLAGVESVFDAPNLAKADVYDVRDGALPPLPTQLRHLRLTDLQGIRRVEHRPGAPALQSLSIVGSRRFDVTSLSALRRLEEIEISQAVGMINVDALAGLPNLRTLHLERCRALDPIGSLRDLTTVDIHVSGRGAFAREMTELAGDQSNWHFH